ncbi:hypothetical protein MN202_11915 [Rheinheimera muenzenbergensis]|uniref:Uncharacterized protein n=1 Tax=Rheinheimera muenzenbergensis TaxID=1193628 RepID=A0ABU8C8H1_9GAMM
MRVPNSHSYANHKAEQIKTAQRQAELEHVLEKHHTTLVVMNSAEFIELALNIKQQNGMTAKQAQQWLVSLLQLKSDADKIWQTYESNIKFIAGFAAIGLDAGALTVIAKDLKRSGNAFAKYQVQKFQGQQHIILEGYAGMRKHLTGTRYLASNPKIVSMGIGELGAVNAIKVGFIVSVVVSVSFHGLDQLMNDQRTLHHFVGGVAADMVYSVVVSVVSWALVAKYVGAASMMAIGPMLAVVVIGTAFAFGVYFLDNKIQLSAKTAAMLAQLEADITAAKAGSKALHADYVSDKESFLKKLFAIPDLRVF